MKRLTITQTKTNRETNSFKQYLKDVSNIKQFADAKEEQKCAIRASQGDEDAKTELVKRNLRFVISVAKQYLNKGVVLEDLVNEGNLGLMTASDRFDPSRGFKFISYAVWYIRKDIQKFITDNSRTIRLPNNKVDAISKYKVKMNKLEQELQRVVDIEDMFDRYHDVYTYDELVVLNELTDNDISSLDMPVGEEATGSLYELIADVSMGRTDHLTMKSDMKVNIDTLLSTLKPVDKEMLVKLYGLDGGAPRTLAEIGTELNITREGVRLKRDKVFKILKK